MTDDDCEDGRLRSLASRLQSRRRFKVICSRSDLYTWYNIPSIIHNKKVCYRWLHSAPPVKRETRILPIGGSMPLGTNFTRTGSYHAKMLNHSIGSW